MNGEKDDNDKTKERQKQKEEHVGHSKPRTNDLNHRGFSSKIYKSVYRKDHLRSRLKQETQRFISYSRSVSIQRLGQLCAPHLCWCTAG